MPPDPAAREAAMASREELGGLSGWYVWNALGLSPFTPGAPLYAIGSLLPAPLRSTMVKALASPRVFNLTISQSPGPRGDLRVLGCEMDEVYSVVPISEQHSLAIGMVRYRRELFIGCYADPVALPECSDLPALLDAELHALAEQRSRAGDAPVAG